jgi:hypothetical protein
MAESGFEKTILGMPPKFPMAADTTLDIACLGIPLSFVDSQTLLPPEKAIIGGPADSDEDIIIQTDLDWSDGGGTLTYDVYLDTVNPPVTKVGSSINQSRYTPATDLEYETIYYWRIDAINTFATTEGDVWSFTTAPLTLANKVINSDPELNETGYGVQRNPSWEDGGGPAWYYDIPNTYDVYFGKTNPPVFKINQSGLSYEPGILDYDQLYFWRIDVVNPDGTQEGDLLYFSTAPQTPPGKATAPDPADNALAVAIQQFPALAWTPGAWSETFDVYVGLSSGMTVKVTTVSDPTYIPTGLILETEYFWRIDCANYDGITTGDEWSFTTGPIQLLKELNLNEFSDGKPLATLPIGTEQPLDEWVNGMPARFFLNPAYGTTPVKPGTPSPPDDSTTASIFSILSWIDTMDYMNYDVYFGETDPPPFIGNQATKSYDPGQLDYETLYYWRIDPIQEETGTGDVWSFTTLPVTPPNEAIIVTPIDGGTDVATNKVLFWTDGGLGTSYNVYFGTSNPPASIGNQIGTSYDPGDLEPDTEYFWRIDAVNYDGMTTGTVWSFRTRGLDYFVNPQRRNIIVVTS